MKKIILILSIFWASLLMITCNQSFRMVSQPLTKEVIVDYTHPDIVYTGRIDTTEGNNATLYWSGSSIKINFEGTRVEALLQDERSNNYYNIILDNDSIILLRPGTTKEYHELVSGLPPGKHTLELFRRTEFSRGQTKFYGFKISNQARLLPKSAPKKRKIEFYGNSITAGYANEDYSGSDNPDSSFTNNYKSYAALTARHFDADYSCICKGGIGITISWFSYIMPDIYMRLNPMNPDSKWDFSIYTPDVVVVNLFQNDSWLVKKPERKEFKETFGTEPPSPEYIIDAYKEFITSLRNVSPHANIICALGSMDATKEGSPWPGYIEQAVEQLNDGQIHTVFFPYKGTKGHPSVEEHAIMADQLIQYIDQHIKW